MTAMFSLPLAEDVTAMQLQQVTKALKALSPKLELRLVSASVSIPLTEDASVIHLQQTIKTLADNALKLELRLAKVSDVDGESRVNSSNCVDELEKKEDDDSDEELIHSQAAHKRQKLTLEDMAQIFTRTDEREDDKQAKRALNLQKRLLKMEEQQQTMEEQQQTMEELQQKTEERQTMEGHRDAVEEKLVQRSSKLWSRMQYTPEWIPIAMASSPQVEIMQKHLGLTTEFVRFEDDPSGSEEEEDPFVWEDMAEDAPKQREKYLAYTTQHFKDTIHPEGSEEPLFFVKDTSQEEMQLLSDGVGTIGFPVKGTADVMIVDRNAERYTSVFAGHCFLVDVKRDCNDPSEIDYCRSQVLLKLVIADLEDNGGRAPMGLLTDLLSRWDFFWFTADKQVVVFSVQSPTSAFKFISETLQTEIIAPSTDIFPLGCPMICARVEPSLLRRKRIAALVPDSSKHASTKSPMSFSGTVHVV